MRSRSYASHMKRVRNRRRPSNFVRLKYAIPHSSIGHYHATFREISTDRPHFYDRSIISNSISPSIPHLHSPSLPFTNWPDLNLHLLQIVQRAQLRFLQIPEIRFRFSYHCNRLFNKLVLLSNLRFKTRDFLPNFIKKRPTFS